jgi:hypothetical protein
MSTWDWFQHLKISIIGLLPTCDSTGVRVPKPGILPANSPRAVREATLIFTAFAPRRKNLCPPVEVELLS